MTILLLLLSGCPLNVQSLTAQTFHAPVNRFRLYVNWRFMRGIEAQFLALQKGFNELVPQHLLKPFDHKELEVRTPLTTISARLWATMFPPFPLRRRSLPPCLTYPPLGS